MIFEEFRSSLSAAQPPQDAPPLLAALWWDAKGDWAKAHEIAQEIESQDAAWVHAYLHRKEGNQGMRGIGIAAPASLIREPSLLQSGKK